MIDGTVRVSFLGPDEAFYQALVRALGAGFEVHRSETTSNGKDWSAENWGGVLFLDLRAASSEDELGLVLGSVNGLAHRDGAPPTVVLLANDDPTLARKMMENGAFRVIHNPPDMVELRLTLQRACRYRNAERELAELRTQQAATGRLQELIGTSEAMQQVFALAHKIAPCDVSVLITGETGTGKELLARAIHRLSSRASEPFVAFSCANLPETLVEDEIFGHEKGAFTGAVGVRRGRLEAADRGTLFLDEVGDLGLGLQPKLLRVLQERTFERLGSNKPVSVSIRLVCATNKNLAEMVQRGEFREDLFYRMNVVQIHLPALRDHRDDIPCLAYHFLQRFAQQFGKKTKRFSRPALQALEEHPWPGNVRELENVAQRAVVLAEDQSVEIWHLPSAFNQAPAPAAVPVRSYEEEVKEFKRRLIMRTLRECRGCKSETARKLGVARNYLHRLINQLQIRPNAEPAVAEAPEMPVPATERIM